MRRIVAALLVALVATLGLGGCTSKQQVRTSPTRPPRNLSVTSAVQARLISAAAAIKGGLPASAFVGLTPHETYYSFDPADNSYWAGASLVPSRSSTAAQVSVQDDGSYDLFRRSPGGSWRAWDVGLTGIAGTRCPIAVPGPVLRLWHWPSGACRPPGH